MDLTLFTRGDTFKCAFITHSDQYTFGKVSSMKRHNKSDEVFILVTGKAVLLTGDPAKKQFKTQKREKEWNFGGK